LGLTAKKRKADEMEPKVEKKPKEKSTAASPITSFFPKTDMKEEPGSALIKADQEHDDSEEKKGLLLEFSDDDDDAVLLLPPSSASIEVKHEDPKKRKLGETDDASDSAPHVLLPSSQPVLSPDENARLQEFENAQADATADSCIPIRFKLLDGKSIDHRFVPDTLLQDVLWFIRTVRERYVKYRQRRLYSN
jgi:hypothetical protein